MLNKVLYADSAATAIHKYYGKSNMTLAALVPATLVSPSDSIPAKIADVGIAAVVPFHAHVGMSVGTLRPVKPSGFGCIPSFHRFFHLTAHFFFLLL
jgi:hypothetical protein